MFEKDIGLGEGEPETEFNIDYHMKKFEGRR